MWKCTVCGEISAFGMTIGNPRCNKDNIELVKIDTLPAELGVAFPPVSMAGQVTVGGNVDNSGIIKVFPDGKFSIDGNLTNTGSLTINDPEKIKELLIELVRTTGTVAELGTEVLKRFFGSR